jgi:hypothetical protein
VSSPDWKIYVLADQQGNCARSPRAVERTTKATSVDIIPYLHQIIPSTCISLSIGFRSTMKALSSRDSSSLP